MTAIYKKELKGFFTSMVGFVFIAFLLVVNGIYFTAYHLQGMYPVFSYTLQSVVFVFLIVVPILSMRVLAEERRQKTDQLLLTAPVSVEGIVVGKYLALVSVFAVTIAVLAVYPLILTQFGSVSMTESYTALFGFFLMGSCYLAIGLYISSVTESQVIAAVLTFLVLFVCYVSQGIGSFFPETAFASYVTFAVLAAVGAAVLHHMIHQWILASLAAVIAEGALLAVYLINASFYEGLIQKLFGVFDLTAHFSEFSSGMFDVRGVVYYLTFIVGFLFLTVQSIQKRRWGERRLKNGSYSVAMTAVVAAGAVAVNLIVSELPSQYTQLDVSEMKLSSLTDQSKEFLAGLDKDVTLYYIVQDTGEDTNVSHLLERYEGQSSHVKVERVDPVLSPNFAAQYTAETLPDNSVIAVCGEANRVISYSEMYESEFNYSYYTYETTGFDAEGQITSAIAAVSSEDLPKLYTLTGHGELEINSVYAQSIEKENIETEALNLLTAEQVPEDADCLLIASPTSDLSNAETQKILAYLRTGGNAIIITDYEENEMPNLNTVLNYYGVSLVDGVVLEKNSNYYSQVPYYLIPDINSTEITADMTGGQSYTFLAAAQGLQISDEVRDTLNITSVLSTSDTAYSKINVTGMTTYEKEEGDIAGPFELGVIATETVEVTEELLEEINAALESGEFADDLGTLDLGTVEPEDPEDAEAKAGAAAAEALIAQMEKALETENAAEDVAAEGDDAAAEESNDAAAEESSDAAATEESGEEASAENEEETELTTEASEETVTADTKVAVFTSSTLIDASADQMVSGGNSKLFMNTLSWMCGHTSTVSVPVKSLAMDYLTVTAAAGSFWSIIVIAVIPGMFLISGLVIWLRRRKQ